MLNFLGVKNKKKSLKIKPYHKRIPVEQKHLHNNIISKPLKDKIDFWVKNLSKVEIYTIQRIAAKKIKKLGYEIIEFNEISKKEKLLHGHAHLREDSTINAKNLSCDIS